MRLIIPASVQQDIATHARETPNVEICGYWLPNDRVIRVTNIADSPTNSFKIDVDYHLSIMRRYPTAVIYHSHWGNNTPTTLSYRDIASSKALRVPYLVYHVEFNEWDYYDPIHTDPYPLIDNPHPATEVKHYLGHVGQWERWDCYSLMRNYYRGALGINLSDFSRKGESEGVTIGADWNQFIENYESQGFLPIVEGEALKDNDVIFTATIGPNLSHVIIVVDAANRIGMHVLGEGRLSELVSITDARMRKPKLIVRHRNFSKIS